MIFFANCKINLGLDVLARREDGFHDIQTVMVPVGGLCDVVEIVPANGAGAGFTQSGLTVDCTDANNLCLRAYRLMQERYGVGSVRIHLHKAVPFGAGLGGGSADAAFTIKGIDRVFGLGLATEEMEAVAAELGSDTAFFVRNEPQLASGRGEMLTPYPVALAGKRVVVVKPPFGVSTAEAYGGIKPAMPETPLTERLAGDIGTWRGTVANAFEPHIFAAYPLLAELKQALYDEGAVYASMSGSGSAVYAIFEGADDGHTPDHNAQTGVFPPTLASSLRKRFGKLFVYQQIMR